MIKAPYGIVLFCEIQLCMFWLQLHIWLWLVFMHKFQFEQRLKLFEGFFFVCPLCIRNGNHCESETQRYCVLELFQQLLVSEAVFEKVRQLVKSVKLHQCLWKKMFVLGGFKCKCHEKLRQYQLLYIVYTYM